MANLSLNLKTGDRGFQSLLWTQALGAFNDNAFKTFVALLALASLPAAQAGRLIALAGGLFIVPFILFSTYAGNLADRCGKKLLIVVFKWAELGLMSLSFAGLYYRSIPLLMVLLFLMGVHSAFFGPVKLAIVPEILEDRDLSRGNGLMQMTSFLGIILGTVVAGLLVQHLGGRWQLASLVFMLAAAAGVAAAYWVAEVPAEGGREPFRLNFAAEVLDTLRQMHGHYGVFLAVVGSAYFWFVGALFQMNILVYGKQLMGLSEEALSRFQIAVAVGIGLGSYAAGRLSRDRVELGLVPVGALGLVLFSGDLAFSFHSTFRTAADLLLLGASGGCFAVPLQVFIQQRSPQDQRGRYIATGNVLSFAAILIASAWLWAFSETFRLNPGQIFLVISCMTLAVAAYIIWMLPDFFLRLLLYPLANLIYRIQVEGQENVPLEGPALLVANHVSRVDPALISGALQRLVRFLMYRTYYQHPMLHPIARAMKTIPIADTDNPKELLRSLQVARKALEEGELVCIFAEGEITRHGQMLPFRKGFERIVKGTGAPIIPVHLDRVWGSIFSFEGGKFDYKWPRRIPYPVTVSFGKPLPSSATAPEVRRAIVELGAAAFEHRLKEKPTLPIAVFREARRHPLRFAMADSSGASLSYGAALVKAWALGGALVRGVEEGGSVGLLLPPSVPGALANLGVSLRGRVPVNLNYTSSRELVEACMAKAGIKKLVTSRALLEKLGWAPLGNEIYLEDLAKGISKAAALGAAAALFALPRFLVERLVLAAAGGPLQRTATVMFTSGSTGQPKGVVLSHDNLQANIEGMAQIYQVGPTDRILGVLPFFHSFGFTATLWFPLVCGFGAVYHSNPLDSKRIGELAKLRQATMLVGTPTFLSAYIRRIEPEQFKSLRFVVVGAEKLRAELGKAFLEKFGLAPLEGYGCTELSPVAAVNIPDFVRPGAVQKGRKEGTVGQPLPGIMMKTVDPESGADLPPGSEGLLLVKGPNVMRGYLGEPQKSAEVLRDGWYVTGDIARVDEEGYLSLTDRLSRFSKIGGEMVPHIKLEEALHQAAGLSEQSFFVSSVPDEKRGERLVVLFRGYDDVDGLCKKLNASELPRLWLPSKGDFYLVESFALLGSGKLDLKKLKDQARALAVAGVQEA